MQLEPYLTPYIKIRMLIDLNVRTKTVKLSVEHISVNLHDLGLSNGFLDTTQ